MRLNKLPKSKPVTITDLLHVSDKNEAKQSVIEALETACEESRKFDAILIITRSVDLGFVTYRAGFTNADIVYVTEMAKHKALQEDCGEGECDCEECGE
jgi:hypothetical protein